MKHWISGFFGLLSGALIAQSPVLFLPKSPSDAELRAATALQYYLGKMTGQPVRIDTEVGDRQKNAAIFIGNSAAARAAGFDIPEKLPDDAYFLEGKNGAFAIGGGGAMGPEYAAYSLLEWLGCRRYSPRDTFIPQKDNWSLPVVPATIEKPAFPYRELWYEPAFDESWARWHKLKTNPQKNIEWGLFVHTFDKLCPKDAYFAQHPEYFAFNGAQRSPGQLCLSNDTVFQIVCASLRERIQQKPEARYWSLSQNDNYDYCKCPRCAATDRQHGGPAGTLLLFVNRVAAEFPDKIISTLAYQYTRQAPKGIQPAPNVSICLCSIECNCGQSIETGCPDFARDLREWSALTPNLMIWDYVVQFRSYLGPFPNWHTLQPNLQFFQQNGVKMMFEQGSGHDRSEFSDMRAYLLAKLMWNPKVNQDSILNDFGSGYYGAAHKGVRQLIHEQTERMHRYGHRLWIYDVPQNEAFVQDSFMQRFLKFGQIIPKPKDSVYLKRLDPVFASECFSFLENLKSVQPRASNPESQTASMMMYVDQTSFQQLLQEFQQLCVRSGLHNLHENGYSPAQYVADYQAFLTRNREALLSAGDSIRLEIPASPKYAGGRPQTLVNHLVGETDYRCNWLGFEGTDLQAILEWPEPGPFPLSTVQISFLQDQASWVFYPEKVVFEISFDGEYFQTIEETAVALVPDPKKAFQTFSARLPATPIRSIRVRGVNVKKCPAWHTCNGSPCWIFADEIIVR